MKPATVVAYAADDTQADVRPALDARANRYDVVSRLADDLAHEIKNPLNAIVVNLEVLRRKIDAGAPDVARDRADVIGEEVTRVHALVDQLLQLLRPARAEHKVNALDEIIEELHAVLEVQAKAARVDLEVKLASGAFINGGRDSLKFAVLNLVVAMYAAPQPPQQISIVTRSTDHAEIVLSSSTASLTEADDLVQHARAWISTAGGSLELTEQSTAGGGSVAVLRMPTCSSFG
jgi:two-component system C4-dicarboxylate transport sensor histidine kinase DctB